MVDLWPSERGVPGSNLDRVRKMVSANNLLYGCSPLNHFTSKKEEYEVEKFF